MTGASHADPSERVSFRDPAGYVLLRAERVLRVVRPEGAEILREFLGSACARRRLADGSLVGTRFLDERAGAEALRDGHVASASVVVEHERVPFPSFPYEWSPSMLREAGALTLDLALDLLDAGFGLKDATPYNVLFRGPEPVFVDVLSVERREPRDPSWRPYGQFVRTFLLPLHLDRRRGIPCSDLLLTRPDGVPPEDAYRMLGRAASLLPPLLTLVAIPTWLGRTAKAADPATYGLRRVDDPEKARFILRRILGGLRRSLDGATPRRQPHSAWSKYMQEKSYTQAQFAEKEAFVRRALEDSRPKRVLDIGCNTGHFSTMAAQAGASVVAVDSDRAVIDEVWRRARAERLDILPLVVDLARPTPAVGWDNAEFPCFLERARGGFDAVLALAVLHHLLVSARVPLGRVLDLVTDLTRGILVLEYVGPQDPMFRTLTRGRDDLYEDFTEEAFAAACKERFEVVRTTRLDGMDRALYLVKGRRKDGSAG